MGAARELARRPTHDGLHEREEEVEMEDKRTPYMCNACAGELKDCSPCQMYIWVSDGTGRIRVCPHRDMKFKTPDLQPRLPEGALSESPSELEEPPLPNYFCTGCASWVVGVACELAQVPGRTAPDGCPWEGSRVCKWLLPRDFPAGERRASYNTLSR